MEYSVEAIKEVEIVRGFWARLKGWIGKTVLPGSALIIYPCSTVHTCFLREPIDVVFINQEGRVIVIIDGMMPWRVSVKVREAVAVIQTPNGGAFRAGFREGERLPTPLKELLEVLFEGEKAGR